MIKETRYQSGTITFFDEETGAFAEIQGYREDKPVFIQGGWFDEAALAALRAILDRVQGR